MKKFSLLFIVVSLLLFSTTQAQLIKVGLGGGYTSITSDSFFDDGYQYGGKIVVAIPVLPLNASLNLYNNPLSKEVDGSEWESSFFSAGLGGEFTILPGPIKPYAGLELLYSSASARTSGSESWGETTTDFGLGLGVGAYFTLLPLIDLDLSAHYNMNSLFGSYTFNTTHVRLNILFNLF